MDKIINSLIDPSAQEGDSIEIPCSSVGQMQSVKVKCWRKLKQFKDNTRIDPCIRISMVEKKGIYYVILKKESFPQGAVYVSAKTGTRTPLASVAIDPDKQRIIQLIAEEA